MIPRAPHFKHVLLRGVRYGAQAAMRPEGFSTSIGALFGVLLLVQIMFLLVFGVHARLTLLQDQTDVRLEVLTSNTQTAEDRELRVKKLLYELQQQPYIEDVIYVTSAQAYEKMQQRDPELVTFIEKFGIQNPFPETIGVRLKQLSDYQNLLALLQRPEFSATIDPNFLRTTDQEEQVRAIYLVTSAARSFLIFLIGLLGVVLTLVLVELVRRRVVLRREEILIQQLVGATPMTILVPFGFEILLLLIIGLTLALAASAGVIYLAPIFIPDLAADGIFGDWIVEMKGLVLWLAPWIIAVEFLVLPFLAFVGSFLGLWPRLKTPTLSMS